MARPTLTMTKGLPASGKTTWALERVTAGNGRVKRVNRDDLRAMLDGGRWSKANERLVVELRDAVIVAAVGEGLDVICDDTNLPERNEQRLRELAEAAGASFAVQDFTGVDVEECIRRDLVRERSVGEQVIRRMWRDQLAPKVQPPAWVDGAPTALLVDVDGTLALPNGRSPYDPSRYHTDLPNEPVVALVQSLWSHVGVVVVMSGRDDTYREVTLAWLKEYGIIPDELHMRPAGDRRPDQVVKRELFEQHVAGRLNVRWVVDDRARVVRMWREQLGLTVLHVAEGDF